MLKTTSESDLGALERKRMVVISPHLPRYDRGSSDDRLYNLLHLLVQKAWRVRYLYHAADRNDQRYTAAFRDDVEFFQLPRQLFRHLEQIESFSPDIIWITNLWTIPYLSFANDLVRAVKKFTDARIIVDTMDFHQKKYQRKYDLYSNPEDLQKTRQFLKLESSVYPLADTVVTVTRQEKDDIQCIIPDSAPIQILPNIHPLPEIRSLADKRRHICFLGNFNVNHNIDAGRYFIEEIFPIILKACPDTEFHLVGNGSTDCSHLIKNPQVRIIGHVPDLTPVLNRYRLAVCPLLYGAGMKGKIGLAMANGLPVVTTAVGAEGFPVKDGEDGFIADDAQAFARKCITLLTDDGLWNRFHYKGRQIVADRCSPEAVANRLEKILASPVDGLQKVSSKIPSQTSVLKKGVGRLAPLADRLKSLNWPDKLDLYQDYFEFAESLRPVENPSISVIVISWRFDSDTLECFRRLESERHLNFELIFVDNGAPPKTFDCLKPFINTFIRLNRNSGAYLARNIGALYADAPLLFFLEDDCIPGENLIAAHLDMFQRFDAISIRGVCRPKTPENPYNSLAKHYYHGNRPFPRFVNLEGNASYKADVFFKTGGWDDKIKFGGGGLELAYRLFRCVPNHRKQIYSPDPIIYHDYASNEAHLQSKREKQTRSMQRLQSKYSDFDAFQGSWDAYYLRPDFLIRKTADAPSQGTIRKEKPAAESITECKKLISIVIPTRNRSGFLREAVQSALEQTWQHFEILIIDDGSTDDTGAVIHEMKSDKIRYIRKPHSGAPDTRNFGVTEALGDYILWLDDDDLLLPDALQNHSEVLMQHPEVDILYGCHHVFDDRTGEVLRLFDPKDWSEYPEMLTSALMKGCVIPNPGTMVRRSTYEKIGGYDPNFSRAHDYEFWSRAAASVSFRKNYAILCRYRLHANNMSEGTLIDRSFESQIMRNLVKRMGLKRIYCWLDWENAHAAETVALYMVAENLFNIGDYTNSIRFLNNISEDLWAADIIDLRLKCALFQGKFGEHTSLLKNMSHRSLLTTDQISDFHGRSERYQKYVQNVATVLQNDSQQRMDDSLYEVEKQNYPLPPELLLNMGRALISSGRSQTGLKMIRQAVLCDSTNDLLIRKVRDIVRSGSDWEVVAAARKRLQGEFDNPEEHLSASLDSPKTPKAKHSLKTESAPETDSENPDAIYADVKALAETGDFDQAIDLLHKLTVRFPNNAIFHNDLGVLYANRGENETAYQHYRCSVGIDPANVEIRKNLADFLCIIMKRYDEAATGYAFILKAEPDDVDALAGLAYIELQNKNHAQAEQYCRQALNVKPNHRDLQELLLKIQTANVENSQPVTGSMPVDNKPGSPSRSKRTALSIVVLSSGNRDRINNVLRNIRSFVDERTEIFLLTPQSHAKKDRKRKKLRFGNAVNVIRIRKADGPGRSLNRVMGKVSGEMILVVRDDANLKADSIERLISSRQSMPNPGVSGTLADKTDKDRQLFRATAPDAGDLLPERFRNRRVPVSSVDDFCFVFNRSDFDAFGPFDETFRSLAFTLRDFCRRLSIEGREHFISADVVLSRSEPAGAGGLWVLGDRLEDRSYFDTQWSRPRTDALSGRKSVSLAWTEQAVRSYKQGDFFKGEEALKQALSYDPDNWRAYRLLMDLSNRLGHAENVLKPLAVLSNRDDLPPDMYARIGQVHESFGDPDRAAHFAKLAAEKDPTSPATHNLEGVIAYRNNDSKRAEERFKSAAELDPGWGDPWTNLGTLYWEKGDHETALYCFEKGFILSPLSPNVAASYHAAVAQRDRYERSRPFFEEIVQRYPDFREGWFFLIDVLVQLREYEAALKAIEAVAVRLGVEPDMLSAARKIREKIGPMRIGPGNRPTVSLCMIVKNEEKHIARCLNSLKPIVDEMIVVDTGSTDNTRAIAEVFGAIVCDFEWIDDFSAARNHGLSRASGDWILVMDADEVISTKDHQLFRSVVRRSKSPFPAYSIVTRNYTRQCNTIGWITNDGKYPKEEAGLGWTPSEKVRLFRNDPAIRFEYAVHEVVGPSLLENKIKIKRCDVPVHHYGRLEHSLVQSKGANYLRIGLRKLEKMGENEVALQELAIEAGLQGEYSTAIDLWKRILKINEKSTKAHTNLSSLYGKLEQYDKAVKHAKTATALSPGLKEAAYNQALGELHLGNAQIAAKIAKDLVAAAPDHYPAIFLAAAVCFCVEDFAAGNHYLKKMTKGPFGNTLAHAVEAFVVTLNAVGLSKYVKRIEKGFGRNGHLVSEDMNPAAVRPYHDGASASDRPFSSETRLSRTAFC